MLTSLYLLNEKNEKLDLLCSPFWLEIESFKQEYAQSYDFVNGYQYIYNNQKRTLNNFQFQLEGTAFTLGESKKVDDFVNREGAKFRLFKVDDAVIEHFCNVVFSSYGTSRIARTDKFVQLLTLEKVSNWQTEKKFLSVGSTPANQTNVYDYSYNDSFVYQEEELTNSYNPSQQISVEGDESAPFYIVIPNGGTDIKWTCYSESGDIVGVGRLIGTFAQEVIIDTRQESQGIYVNGVDRRDARDISSNYDHFFNLPIGKSIINIAGIGSQKWYGFYFEQDRLVTSDGY